MVSVPKTRRPGGSGLPGMRGASPRRRCSSTDGSVWSCSAAAGITPDQSPRSPVRSVSSSTTTRSSEPHLRLLLGAESDSPGSRRGRRCARSGVSRRARKSRRDPARCRDARRERASRPSPEAPARSGRPSKILVLSRPAGRPRPTPGVRSLARADNVPRRPGYTGGRRGDQGRLPAVAGTCTRCSARAWSPRMWPAERAADEEGTRSRIERRGLEAPGARPWNQEIAKQLARSAK